MAYLPYFLFNLFNLSWPWVTKTTESKPGDRREPLPTILVPLTNEDSADYLLKILCTWWTASLSILPGSFLLLSFLLLLLLKYGFPIASITYVVDLKPHYVVQASLELTVFLPLLLKFEITSMHDHVQHVSGDPALCLMYAKHSLTAVQISVMLHCLGTKAVVTGGDQDTCPTRTQFLKSVFHPRLIESTVVKSTVVRDQIHRLWRPLQKQCCVEIRGTVRTWGLAVSTTPESKLIDIRCISHGFLRIVS